MAPNFRSVFPPMPSSLNAGDHEMHHWETIHPRPLPNTAPDLTPYLGLRARLSQIWINRWTILLILVLVRTLLAVQSLDDGLGSARKEALSACSSVESMGSAMASMPHYMSQGVNEIAASGVEKAVNGLMSMLMMSVTGVEEIIIFIVNLLTSTYVCLITLAVRGAFQVALKVIENVSEFVNKTIDDSGKEIADTAKSFQDDVNDFAKAFNSVPKIFGSDSSIPELDLSEPLTKLNDLQLPSGLDEDLDKLNSSIPTFEEVQKFTEDVIRLPFEKVKQLMNESMVAYKFDRSVFPVPQKEQLNFCSDSNGINDFFDKLFDIAKMVRRVFIGVITVLAILVCVPMAYREIWRWRTMQKRAQLLGQNSFDPLDVVHITARPYSSTMGIKAAARFRSGRRQILVRWFFAYITSTPALFVLTLGLAGLAACLCQYILLQAVRKETPALANEVGEFAGKVVKLLSNASEQWAVGTNRAIDSTNNEINQEVFGWVNTMTGAVNDTLNAFVDQMSDALEVTFGDTVLHDPIKEVLNCLIGLKIAGIQKGLTWVSDNAQIDFPNLPNDTFSLGAVASISDDPAVKQKSESFLADPGSQASDKITGIVESLTEKIARGIREEALISSFVVLIWIIIVLIGLVRTGVLFCRPDKVRGEGAGPDFASDPTPWDDPRGPPPPPVTSSPAPAYVYSTTTTAAHKTSPSASSTSSAPAVPKEKVGYAGERSGAQLMDPGRHGPRGVVRQSTYPEIGVVGGGGEKI
ncbi:MAG: plasma membrane fusion protein prm1 [Caeruleum heppii]|nr:MAG: plasma membrane fusion protein prm1 [Caeruleum heppii]